MACLMTDHCLVGTQATGELTAVAERVQNAWLQCRAVDDQARYARYVRSLQRKNQDRLRARLKDKERANPVFRTDAAAGVVYSDFLKGTLVEQFALEPAMARAIAAALQPSAEQLDRIGLTAEAQDGGLMAELAELFVAAGDAEVRLAHTLLCLPVKSSHIG